MAFTSFGTDDDLQKSMTNKEQAEREIERIIADNAETVYKLAYAKCGNRADADDVFQQVFLRYISRRPQFESAEHEKAWFIRVTVNCTKSLWSSAFRRKTQPLEGDIPAEMPEDGGLAESLSALPEKYRVLIHLFYYEGLPTAEIARLLKRRESTVRMQLTRARRLLREIMSADEGL
jgi:RNA polymerase sigma-70 factor (ECF subfamily)